MSDNFGSLEKKTRAVSLSPEEKLAMRQSLLEMMERQPAVRAAERAPVLGNLSERWSALSRLFSRPALASVLAGAMLVAGSGVSYAAEGSLPGDPLYAVKVGVNEPVRGFLTISPEDKAAWAAQRVGRRLEEVEVLAAADRLAPVEAGALQRVIQRQTRGAGELLDRLTEAGDHAAAVTVGADLEERLQKHQDRMVRISRHKIKEDRQVLDELAETVGEEAEGLARKNGQSEDRLAETKPELAAPVAADRLNATENRLRETRELLFGQDQPAEPRSEAAQDLDQAGEFLDEGRRAMKSGDLPKAFSKFREAHRRTRAAREMIEADDEDQGDGGRGQDEPAGDDGRADRRQRLDDGRTDPDGESDGGDRLDAGSETAGDGEGPNRR